MDPSRHIPGLPEIPGMPGGATPPPRASAAPARRATPSALDEQRARLRDEISAYPGSLTYLDLIAKNKRESLLLMFGMVLLAGVVFALITAAVTSYAGLPPEQLAISAAIGLVAGLAFAGIGALWSFFGGASAILRMSGARQIDKRDDPELFNVVDEMRIAAGLPMPRIFVINDSALNAFATGRDPEHAAVAITRGLRARLTRDELQGVMAHEMAHVRHYDIRFSMLMATMVGLIVFTCDAFLRSLRHIRISGGSGRNNKGGGAAVLVLVLIALLLAIIAPIFARLIQMSYSRKREYLADAGAVELTRNPEGLASALTKLATDPDPLVDAANRGTAHMFIVNPLKRARASRGESSSLFSSHPPVSKRIAALLALTR